MEINSNKINFEEIFIYLGQDSFEKLCCLHRHIYGLQLNSEYKNRENISKIVSYGIEFAYSELVFYKKDSDMPCKLPPPKTKKAQELYNTYQIAFSLKKTGLSDNEIASHLTSCEILTPDTLTRARPLLELRKKPSRWVALDVEYLLDVKAINELITLLNKRTQRAS